MDSADTSGRRRTEALRVPARRRAAGLALALLLEALLVLVLLTLGTGPSGTPKGDQKPLSTFDIAALTDTPEPAEPVKQEARPSPAEPEIPDQPQPPPPVTSTAPAPPVTLPSPVLALPPETVAQADIRNLPPAPPARPRGPSGPPAPRGEADTPLVDGRGPNGERLYAASWYREPYDSELRGYLSTAQPGWALIACQTVEDFRVDNCVAVDEWPNGSQLARAVLAAAWQFKVRPPRIGGQVKVGEWVRIRIDYTSRRNRS